jgi:hypothetical protein
MVDLLARGMGLWIDGWTAARHAMPFSRGEQAGVSL